MVSGLGVLLVQNSDSPLASEMRSRDLLQICVEPKKLLL